MNEIQTEAITQAQKPAISLIIPVYNVEKYIKECLRSAVEQTFPHLEIICVDDCGQDASMSIVEEFAARDKRIKIVRNAKNLGLAGSRNEALKHCSAPFIMCLDSDDAYEPDMCATMHKAIVSSGADIAMCNIRISYESDTSLKESDDEYYTLKWEGLHPVTESLESACNVNAWNKIYRRDIIKKYEILFPAGLYYEDAYFFHAYMAQAKTIFFVKEKLYHYRRREGSIMNLTFAKASAMGEDHVKIAIALYGYYRKWQLLDKKFAYFCKFFIEYVDIALWHSPSEQAKENILCMAGEFVRENLTSSAGLERETAVRIEQLRHAYPTRSQGTIFRVKTKPMSRHYLFLGSPLYRIKYTPKAQRHYLLGVQIYRRKYMK